jgi:DNA polymerase III alpha subunit
MSQRGRFINLILSDPEGNYEVTIFHEEVLKNYAHLINVKTPVVIHAEVTKDKGSIRITANKFADIEEEISSMQQDLDLIFSDSKDLQHILSTLKSSAESATEVNVKLSFVFENDFLAKISLPNPIKLSSKAIASLEQKYRI